MPEPFDTARRHFMDGVAHHQAGRHAQAEAAFLASLALVPGRPSSLMNLGAAQLAQGRAEEALQTLHRAIAADAGNAQALCHRAAAFEPKSGSYAVPASLGGGFGCPMTGAIRSLM